MRPSQTLEVTDASVACHECTMTAASCRDVKVAAYRDAMAGRHDERRLLEPGLHIPVPGVGVLRAARRAAHQGTTRDELNIIIDGCPQP